MTYTKKTVADVKRLVAEKDKIEAETQSRLTEIRKELQEIVKANGTFVSPKLIVYYGKTLPVAQITEKFSPA